MDSLESWQGLPTGAGVQRMHTVKSRSLLSSLLVPLDRRDGVRSMGWESVDPPFDRLEGRSFSLLV